IRNRRSKNLFQKKFQRKSALSPFHSFCQTVIYSIKIDSHTNIKKTKGCKSICRKQTGKERNGKVSDVIGIEVKKIHHFFFRRLLSRGSHSYQHKDGAGAEAYQKTPQKRGLKFQILQPVYRHSRHGKIENHFFQKIRILHLKDTGFFKTISGK